MENKLPFLFKTRLMSGASALALTGMLNMTMPAMAQEADDSGRIDTIVVTATKRAVNIQDVGQSITAFSTADIERRGIINISNVAAALPSITLTSTDPTINELVYRGISAGTGDWRLDSQVAVYLDDQPMTASTTQLDPRMVDIERVESLPGPQGTLFGSSSQTGTLRIITNKPNFDGYSGQANAELKVTKGGEMSYDFSGHINIPLVDDILALRVVAFKAKDGGYIDNVFSTTPHGFGAVPDNAAFVEENYNDYDVKGGRVSALWNINEDWSANATFMLQEALATGSWKTNTYLGDYNFASFNDEYRDDKWWTAALTLKGDLGFAELSNSFSYANREQSYSFDNTNYEASHTAYGKSNSYYYYPGGEFNYYDLFDTNYNGGLSNDFQSAKRYSNEFRLTSTGNSRLEWMVGAFYENINDGWHDIVTVPNLTSTRSFGYAQLKACELNAAGYNYVPCPLQAQGNNWFENDFAREISQIAAFTEVGYELTDKLHITGGFRWFQYSRYTVDDVQWPPGLPIDGSEAEGYLDIQDGKESDTAIKLSAQYTFDQDHMAYILFSQGFRLGGKNSPRAFQAGFVPQYYESDKMNNYEFGVKTEWLDNRLQINAAVFYMDWNNIQLSIADPDKWHIRGQVNAKGGRNLGAELDITWRVTENLKIAGNAYIGNPYFTDPYINPKDELIMSADTQMPNSARKKFSISADYTIPNVFNNIDMYLRYDFSYRGEMYSDLEQAVAGGIHDIEGTTMSNFQLGLEMNDDLTVTFMVRNLFDQRANSFTSYTDADYGEEFGHPGFAQYQNLARPRTFSLGVRKKF